MIFVGGENLIDIVPLDNKISKYKACIGGSALNTCLGLGRLKSNILFYTQISEDFFGDKKIY